MDKISFGASFLDQKQVCLWGKYVGLCGDKPNMPVNFLRKQTIGFELTEEEKADVLEFVWLNIGAPMRHKQCETAWHVAQKRVMDEQSESGPDPTE